MEGFVFLGLAAAFMIVLSLAGLAFGVDSSDSSFDPRQPARPVGLG